MADAIDDPELAAVMKLRAARSAEAEAFKACDSAERSLSERRRDHDAARSAVTAALRELDRVRDTLD